jgi:mRNA-degrading endonuclease YafQ of YafQ-DinJ toxin-antitoxin module
MEINGKSFENETKKAIKNLTLGSKKFNKLIKKLQEGLDNLNQKNKSEENLTEEIKK